MRRRFRRRPRLVALLTAALAALVLFRLGWNWTRRTDSAAGLSASTGVNYGTLRFAAGPCKVLRVQAGNVLLIEQMPAQGRADGTTAAVGPVRLLGIRPSLDAPDAAADPLAETAQRFTEDFLRGGQATLSLDKRRVDESGCFLAYVDVEGQSLNVELVRAGLARQDARPGDSATMARLLKQAEAEARFAGRGLWNDRPPQDGR